MIKMKMRKIIAVMAAMVIGIGVLTGCGSSTDTNTADTTETANKVTPTFMYFVSNSDENFDETNAMIEELKGEYDGKVNFDIVNIDENPEAATNFPVKDQTPALIMLNTNNDISAMEFKCSDKATLTEDIETALSAE